MPATTAVDVASSRPSVAEHAQRPERVRDEAAVGEDRLPGERPDQVRDEERRDDQQQQQVLPAPAAEGDEVRERVADEERDHGRDARRTRASARTARGTSRSRPSSCPRPGEDVADVERALLERRVRRGSRSGRRRRARGTPAPAGAAGTGAPTVPVQPGHHPGADDGLELLLQLLSSAASASKIFTLASVSAAGKMSSFVGELGVDRLDLVLRALDGADVVHVRLDLRRHLRPVDEVHERRGGEDVAARRDQHVVGPDLPARVGDAELEVRVVGDQLHHVARPRDARPRGCRSRAGRSSRCR